jgi:hypothetical protein
VRIDYDAAHPDDHVWTGCSTGAIPGAGGSGILCVRLQCFLGPVPESNCYNGTSWQLSFTCEGVFTDTQTDNPPNPCACGPPLLLTWVTVPGGDNDVCCAGPIKIVTVTVTE